MEPNVKSYMTGTPIALDVEASALSALRIPDGRLRALPGTTLCLRCARASEEEGAA
jgi:hypothetical protein